MDKNTYTIDKSRNITPNPTYGVMGRAITSTDTAEMQARQAEIANQTIKRFIEKFYMK